MSASGSSTRVLIADDHPLFRSGLRALLQSTPDLEIVGEATNGMEALELVSRLAPEILILDLAMPVKPGLEVLRELEGARVEVRVVVLTASIERPQIVEALRLGARGVVLKDSATELLIECIGRVRAGEYWVGRDRISDVIGYLLQGEPPLPEPTPARKFGLTPRELEIVGAIVGGSGNRDIARQLGISQDTVKHHLTNIFDKVGVSSRLELALFAVHHRLVAGTGPVASG